MGNRRNYSDATIKQLFAKSGNRCSFPGCSAFISIEIVGSGDIAHIEGKNRGSPRYNEDQSDLERDAEENIILLCQHHHKVTDDTQIYTVGVLKEMKRQHEGSIAFITGFAKQIETETVSDVAPDGTLTIRPKKIEDVIKFHETVFASSVDRTTGLPFDPAKPVYIQQLGETKVPVVFEAVSYAIITISPDARSEYIHFDALRERLEDVYPFLVFGSNGEPPRLIGNCLLIAEPKFKSNGIIKELPGGTAIFPNGEIVMFSDLKNHLDLRKTANVIRNITRTHKQIWNQTVQVKAGIRRKVPTGVAFLTDGRVVLQGQIISQDSDTREYRVPAGSPCLHILADLAEGAGAFNYSNFEHRLTLGEALDIGVYTRPKRNLSGMSDDN